MLSRAVDGRGPHDPEADGSRGGYAAIRRDAAAAIARRSVLRLGGADTLDFLHRLTTNDLLSLPDPGSRRTVIVDEKARIVDLVTVVRNGGRVSLVGSPGNGATLARWLERFIIADDVTIGTVDDDLPLPAVFGPASAAAVGSLSGGVNAVAGPIPGGWISIPDPIGSIAGTLFLTEGEERLPPPAILAELPRAEAGALEQLRVEERVPGLGREMGPAFNALEAGLKEYISFTKGCYIGQEVIARLDTYRKLRRIISLFRIRSDSPGEPPTGPLLQEGTEAGLITSVASSPLHGGWIGLGYRPLAAGDAEYALDTGAAGEPIRCTCISGLPGGYEEYEAEA